MSDASGDCRLRVCITTKRYGEPNSIFYVP